jgi:transposase-like protein
MSEGFKNKNDLISSKVIENKSEIDKKTESSPDPQVKPKKHYSTRRSFDTAYKLRILAAFDACESAVERGTLLRKEGLYHSRITAWRQQFSNSKLTSGEKKSKALRTDHLVRENEQLKKKLAQAEAIIDIQKKVSELLGKHILPNEDTE